MPHPRAYSGYKFLRATAIKAWRRIPSYGEIEARELASWFPDAEPPALALFVFHRWNDIRNPDPDGRQLAALQLLIAAIEQVAAAMNSDAASRAETVGSLWRHGYLQAAAILGAAQERGTESDSVWSPWRLLWQRCGALQGEALANALIEQIGFWFDFACMPQPSNEIARERDKLDTPFQRSLFRLPELMAACPMLILRMPDDSYEERAWCVTELLTGNGRERHITLRVDLSGQLIARSDVLVGNDRDPALPIAAQRRKPRPASWKDSLRRLLPPWRLLDISFDWPARSFLADALDRWTTGVETNLITGEKTEKRWWASDVFQHYWEQNELEETRSPPFFTTPPAPLTFPGQLQLFQDEINATMSWSEYDRVHGRLHGGADLETVVRQAMRRADLKCSEDFDLVFNGLTILYMRRLGSPTRAAFYADARLRWLSRRTLKLCRSRADLEPYAEKCWYIFEDERADARPLPNWADSSAKI
jgi:hypothetical protein